MKRVLPARHASQGVAGGDGDPKRSEFPPSRE